MTTEAETVRVQDILRPLAEREAECPRLWDWPQTPEGYHAETCPDCHGAGSIPDPRFEALRDPCWQVWWRRKEDGAQVSRAGGVPPHDEHLAWSIMLQHPSTCTSCRGANYTLGESHAANAILETMAACGLRIVSLGDMIPGWVCKIEPWFWSTAHSAEFRDQETAPIALARCLVKALGYDVTT